MQKCPGLARLSFSVVQPKRRAGIIQYHRRLRRRRRYTVLADIAALMVISGVMAFGATSTWALVGSGISRLLNSPRALATFNGVMGALLALSLIPVFL